ncbi:MAG TPA: universal stress protein [Acidimicrobiales bacterium]|nr:universal stress protein [Acidimicrobiales bacterium]
MTRSAPERLRVLGGRRAIVVPEAWRPLAAQVAALASLPISVELDTGERTTDHVLRLAAVSPEPMLVLPSGEPPGGHEGVLAGALRKVLAPLDLTEEEGAVLARWIERALDRGIGVEQLHVLSPSSLPAMWEGPGHHAAAWRAEMFRRHRVDGSLLALRSGDALQQIVSEAPHCDLLLVYWRGDPSRDRAGLVRSVLAEAPTPVLLVREPPAPALAA